MQGAVISRTIDELLCFYLGFFFFYFSSASWKIHFLSTLKNTPIALMQGVMFGFSTKSPGETERKRLVFKGRDDLPAIVQLQNCASDRHSFKVKIVRKQFFKSRLFKMKKLITVVFF